MMLRTLLSIAALASWSTIASAQNVKSTDIDLDAFARKVAQETVRSLRKAGALKSPGTADSSVTSASSDQGRWQTSTSMEPTQGHLAQPSRFPLANRDSTPTLSTSSSRKISGLEAGIEAVFAKPLLGQEHGGSCCQSVLRTPNHGLTVSPRIWLGWMSENGYGLRARYYSLSSASAVYSDADGSAKQRLKYTTADFEMAYHDSWTNWDVIWSLGARYLDMTTRAEIHRNGYGSFLKLSTFKGIGPLASVELRRRTGDGLSPFALFRAGFVAGEIRADSNINDDFLYVVDDVFDFYEAKAGLEYLRLWGGTTLFFRGAVEAMFMPRAAAILDGTGDQQEDNEHLAIRGGTVSFGARF